MSQGARKYLVFFVLLLGLAVFCAMGCADQEKAAAPDEKPPVVAEETKKSKLEDLTKEKLLERISGALKDPEVLGMVAGVGKAKDASGQEYLVMKSQDGSVKKLEDLDKKTLVKLLMRAQQARTIVNTQRIQKQMEQIQRMQNIQNLQRTQQNIQGQIQKVPVASPIPQAPPTNPPLPPRTHTPPSEPRKPGR